MPLAMAAGADRSEQSIGLGVGLIGVGLKRWTRKRHHGHLRVKKRPPVARKKAQEKPEAVAGARRLATPWPFHIPSTALHPCPMSQLQWARCSPFPPPLYKPAYQAQL